MHKYIAFIPVRGGSKSIPMKNIRIINQRPLVYWCLDAAVMCEEIDHVFVSTDSEEIKQCVLKYDHQKVTVVSRSEDVSTDTASTESVMLEFAKTHDFENIVLLQATSPLITSQDISNGIKRFSEKGIDSVLSVVRQKRFIWKEEGSQVVPYNYDPLNRPRRQDFEGYLVENGALYITSKERLLQTKCRISGNISAIEMTAESYYELDEWSDWYIIESLLKMREQSGMGV